MNRRILKINSWILTIVGTTILSLFTIFVLLVLLRPSEPNSFDDLGKYIAVIGIIVIASLNAPLLISSVGTLKYLKGKNNFNLCIIFSIIAIILYGSFIFIYVYNDLLNIFKSNNIIITIISILLILCPLLTNIILLFKEKNKTIYQ